MPSGISEHRVGDLITTDAVSGDFPQGSHVSPRDDLPVQIAGCASMRRDMAFWLDGSEAASLRRGGRLACRLAELMQGLGGPHDQQQQTHGMSNGTDAWDLC